MKPKYKYKAQEYQKNQEKLQVKLSAQAKNHAISINCLTFRPNKTSSENDY